MLSNSQQDCPEPNQPVHAAHQVDTESLGEAETGRRATPPDSASPPAARSSAATGIGGAGHQFSGLVNNRVVGEDNSSSTGHGDIYTAPVVQNYYGDAALLRERGFFPAGRGRPPEAAGIGEKVCAIGRIIVTQYRGRKVNDDSLTINRFFQDFHPCRFVGGHAKCNGVKLINQDLNGFDFSNSSFKGAKFQGAQMYEVTLTKTLLRHANITGVTGLTEEMLAEAIFLEDGDSCEKLGIIVEDGDQVNKLTVQKAICIQQQRTIDDLRNKVLTNKVRNQLNEADLEDFLRALPKEELDKLRKAMEDMPSSRPGLRL